MLRYLAVIAIVMMYCGCKTTPHDESVIADPDFLHDAHKTFSDVIVYDIFSPPVASRNYAYASIAAYEAMAQADSTYKSLSGQITDLSAIPPAPSGCLLYTSPSPRDATLSRMPSSA